MSYQHPLPVYGDCLPEKKVSSMEIIQSISFLTKLGALSLITGKIFMLVAVVGIFVPALSAYAIPCTIIWGSLVFTSIILCSVDHYITRRKNVAGNLHILAKDVGRTSQLLRSKYVCDFRCNLIPTQINSTITRSSYN